MSSYTTNGHIIQRLISADREQAHEAHAEAHDYLTSFRNMENVFFEKVHPLVDVGLAISETQAANRNKPNIFTVHGCRHISDLIKSMDKLAQSIAEDNPDFDLTVLEAYILLCAAHVHDAANVKERAHHPQRCNEILQKHKALFASPVTIQQIFSVASVHGNRHKYFGKDTIRSLEADNSSKPRLPLLASLLRLGDELSENPERVPDIVNEAHEYSEISKLAHAYARSFASFELRKDTLYLVFSVYPAERDLKVRDNPSGCMDFLDYLETKIDVIERESRYCSQYGRPMLGVSKISVTINLYVGDLPSTVGHTLKFDLHLAYGYPETILPLCKRSSQLKERNVNCLADCLTQSKDHGQRLGTKAKSLPHNRTAFKNIVNCLFGRFR